MNKRILVSKASIESAYCLMGKGEHIEFESQNTRVLENTLSCGSYDFSRIDLGKGEETKQSILFLVGSRNFVVIFSNFKNDEHHKNKPIPIIIKCSHVIQLPYCKWTNMGFGVQILALPLDWVYYNSMRPSYSISLCFWCIWIASVGWFESHKGSIIWHVEDLNHTLLNCFMVFFGLLVYISSLETLAPSIPLKNFFLTFHLENVL